MDELSPYEAYFEDEESGVDFVENDFPLLTNLWFISFGNRLYIFNILLCCQDVLWQGFKGTWPSLFMAATIGNIFPIMDYLFQRIVSPQYQRFMKLIIIHLSGIWLLWLTFGEDYDHLAFNILFCLNGISVLLVQCLPATLVPLFVFGIFTSMEFFVEETLWHKIRGTSMLMGMRTISVALELRTGPELWPVSDGSVLFTSFYLTGYMLNPLTLIYGPWISFGDFLNFLADPVVVTSWTHLGYSLCVKNVIGCLQYSRSLLYLLISTCGHSFLFGEHVLNKWIRAYGDAQSFRFSHYFICSMAETASSWTNDRVAAVEVAKPMLIEAPRSLVLVVVNWNRPMHTWLRNYVFLPVKEHFGNAVAIFITYITSALLHGLNFQLSAVLLSLGLYTYVEYVFRKRLSQRLDACVGARACPASCSHVRKDRHVLVMLVNILFSLLAIAHLAYLGLLFDSTPSQDKGYSMWHTLNKWRELHFLSHGVAVFNLILCFLL